MRLHRDMLTVKLRRAMRQNAMQFVSLILLCMLGVFLFSGIDSFALITQASNDAFFSENHLAHFFIGLDHADRHALARIRAIDGVKDAAARFTLDMDADLPGSPKVNVTAFDGAMTINTPLLREGELLDPGDLRGCLIQERYAAAQGLALGDRISVKLNGEEISFVIRGVCVSPEYVALSMGVASNPNEYGFILVNARALPQVPLTQAIVTMEDGADEDAVQAAIEAEQVATEDTTAAE